MVLRKQDQAFLAEFAPHDEEGGFFYRFRQGNLDRVALQKACQTLQTLDLSGEYISKDVVAQIWSLPLFMECNKDFVISRGANQRWLGSFEQFPGRR